MIFAFGTIMSVMIGIVLMLELTERGGTADGLIVLAVIAGGTFGSWITSLLIYGFGELIEKTVQIERNTNSKSSAAGQDKKNNKNKAEAKKATESKREDIQENDPEENCICIECPECGEELFFEKKMTDAECPYCGAKIKIK